MRLLILLMALTASATDVLLLWDANPTNDQVLAYYVYQATNVAGPFLQVTNSATNVVRVAVPAKAQYFWYVTASNFWSESGPSNVAGTPPQSGNVTNVKVLK